MTVTNTSDPNPATNTKTIQVAVNDYSAADNYGPLTTAYPAAGATNAYTDGELALTFDVAPTLNPGGTIKIYKKSDGTQVDSISFAGETQTFVTGPPPRPSTSARSWRGSAATPSSSRRTWAS